jgi:hypothetical protein
LETRPLTGLTGVSLEMNNAVRLIAIAQQSIHCHEQAHVSARNFIVPAAVNK